MKRGLYLVPVILLLLASACGNRNDSVRSLTISPKGPVMSAKNIVVIFSDSGRLQAKLFGKVVNRYSTPQTMTEFPKGLKIIMYDSVMNVKTTIDADYGKRMENQRIMEARGHVVVRNVAENKQLETEQLTWDENRRLIFSSVPVKITTNNMILFGDGLESNENFSRYNIKNPHGQMMVKKDSI